MTNRRKARQNAKRNKLIIQAAGIVALALPVAIAAGVTFGGVAFLGLRNLGIL